MKKKTILVAAIAVMLVAALVVGGTLAYFTDKDSATNTFTLGNVAITLDEASVTKTDNTWSADKENRVKANDYGTIYPGAVLPKDPTVHNTGVNGAYIRATVNVSNCMNMIAAVYPDAPTYPAAEYVNVLADYLVDQLGEGWSVVGVTGGDTFKIGQFDAKFILKYDGVLASGDSTTPMFTNVTVPAEFKSGSDYLFNEMKIEAQAIQADGFDNWEAAFNAFDGK